MIVLVNGIIILLIGMSNVFNLLSTEGCKQESLISII